MLKIFMTRLEVFAKESLANNNDIQNAIDLLNTILQTNIVGKENDTRQVAAGARFTLFLKDNGEVWGCGDNEEGQLGLNVREQKIPVKIPKSTSLLNFQIQECAEYKALGIELGRS